VPVLPYKCGVPNQAERRIYAAANGGAYETPLHVNEKQQGGLPRPVPISPPALRLSDLLARPIVLISGLGWEWGLHPNNPGVNPSPEDFAVLGIFLPRGFSLSNFNSTIQNPEP
jgi:hypothetical protein